MRKLFDFLSKPGDEMLFILVNWFINTAFKVIEFLAKLDEDTHER